MVSRSTLVLMVLLLSKPGPDSIGGPANRKRKGREHSCVLPSSPLLVTVPTVVVRSPCSEDVMARLESMVEFEGLFLNFAKNGELTVKNGLLSCTGGSWDEVGTFASPSIGTYLPLPE